MRKIVITPKNTAANTQYWEMSAEDRAWLMVSFMEFLTDIQEIATHDDMIRQEMFRRRPSTYPRGRRGPNSHASMLGGITRTLLDGRDITTAHIDVIEALSDLVAAYDHSEPVRFERRLWSTQGE